MNETRTNKTPPKRPAFFNKKKAAPAKTTAPIDSESAMVYIGNLRYKRDEKGIKFLFSRYGKVEEINIIKNPGTDTSKGYAFVKMPDWYEAELAVKGLNGAVIDGRTLKVSIAQERDHSDGFEKIEKLDPVQEQKALEKEMRKRPVRKKKKGLEELMTFLNR